jgi:hypothetical protein
MTARRRELTIDDLAVLCQLAERLPVPPSAAALLDELEQRGLFSRDGGETTGAAEDAADDEPNHYSLERGDSLASPQDGVVESTASFALVTPIVLRVASRGFEHLERSGEVVVTLAPAEVLAACCFLDTRALRDAFARHRSDLGARALDERAFEDLVRRLRTAGLLDEVDTAAGRVANEGREVVTMRKALQVTAQMTQATDRYLAEHREREAERALRTGTTRTPIVPVDVQMIPQLSLGMVMAHAKAHDGGRLEEYFDFVPDWMNRSVTTLGPDDPPGIYLFSNYIWNHKQNLQVSVEIKQKSPKSLIVHGGPDTPKYQDDVETYLRMNPEVDVIVQGEGEATTADLLDALKAFGQTHEADLAALRDVPGIAFLDGDEVVRTADRERIADVDTIPSPYLTGVFDSVGDAGIPLAVLETNRGCPYGCTFCDWGSATASRIRKFSLDRVFAELEWCAAHKVNAIYLADANFGIFPRDVEIAQKVAELRSTVGYPKVFETNYAKNTVKHLRQCVEILAKAGIITEGILSLQSMDAETLSTIRRSNIKLEEYEALATEFRKANLPLVVDIMMGLPGSTASSFQGDLQECVNREVRARVFPTQLLVNSPMNEPSYRAENQIGTKASIADSWKRDDGGRKRVPIVISSASFTQADYEHMKQVRQLFRLCENFGVLRQVSRYVRHETNTREVEFYAQLARDAIDSPDLTTVAFTFEAVPFYMVPPASWASFIDEVRWYLTTVLGIADDTALDTVLRVQHSLLPSRERSFPEVLDLPHDYKSWHGAILEAKQAGHYDDWPDHVAPLREFDPSVFTVDDPSGICERSLGFRMDFDQESDWELGSPVARAMARRHLHL